MTEAASNYISTRGDTAPTNFADALLRGIAPDGGLYMPAAWPSLAPSAWAPGQSYEQIAAAAMTPYLGDALPSGTLERALKTLVAGFDDPAVTPLVQLEDNLWLLCLQEQSRYFLETLHFAFTCGHHGRCSETDQAPCPWRPTPGGAHNPDGGAEVPIKKGYLSFHHHRICSK